MKKWHLYWPLIRRGDTRLDMWDVVWCRHHHWNSIMGIGSQNLTNC